ncbi:unnamed protein product [Amoebophrya sp. A25]|nr:unnamed protein product [Amoebophrya sp. A25]|eukprot:GSA25T00011830001.1
MVYAYFIRQLRIDCYLYRSIAATTSGEAIYQLFTFYFVSPPRSSDICIRCCRLDCCYSMKMGEVRKTKTFHLSFNEAILCFLQSDSSNLSNIATLTLRLLPLKNFY